MSAKIIGFHSSKTSGTTSVALNAGLLHQHFRKDQSIAVVQATSFPDIHLYQQGTPSHDLGDLKHFINTDEWNQALLKKVAVGEGCDVFCSPKQEVWESFSAKDLEAIIKLLREHYHVIYLDIHRSVPSPHQQYLLNECDSLVLVACPDPVSLETTHVLAQHLKTQLQGNQDIKLLLNQCPSKSSRQLHQWTTKLDLPVAGMLEFEERSFWQQLFQGLPVVGFPKSKWAQSLWKALQSLHQ